MNRATSRLTFLLSLLAALVLDAGHAAVAGARRAAPLPAPAAPAPAFRREAAWDSLAALEAEFQWAASESLASALLDRVARAPAPDSMAYARALIALGTARLRRGLFADGRGYDALERGIAIRARHAPAEDSVLRLAHVRAAILYPDGGRVAEARAHGEQALRMIEATGPLDTLLAATGEMAIGVACSRLGDPAAARVAFDRALALREAKLGRDRPELVPTLAQYGEFLARIGEFDAARALLMRALRNAAANTRPNEDYLEGTVARLSTLERRVGNLAESVDLAERALELTRRRVGDDARETALRRIVLAYRLEEFGDHAASARMLDSALVVMDARAGVENPQTINARLVLLDDLIALGDTIGAKRELAIVRPALARQEALANDNDATFRASEAGLDLARGQLAAARETLELAIGRESERRDPVGVSLAELLAQELDTVRGPGDRALVDHLSPAIVRLRDSTRVRSTPEWTDLLVARAAADARVGLRDEAWNLALEAERLARGRLVYSLQALPDRRALELARELGRPCDLLAHLARPDHEPELVTAWDRIVRWRGLVSHEIERRRLPMSAEHDTALTAAHERWLAAQRTLGQLVVSGAAHPDDPASAGRFEAARQRAEEAERRYVRLASGAVAGEDSVTLANVIARLTAGQALVGFAVSGTGADDASLDAFVVTGAGRRVRVVRLGPEPRLAGEIRAWVARLATPPATTAVARREELACRALGLKVRAHVWEPVARALDGARDVVLVPEGVACELPWLALPRPAGGYLADESRAIRVLNAERELLPPSVPTTASGLLAVGAPDFDAAGATSPAAPPVTMLLRARRLPWSGGPVSLPPLPATRAEVADIARDWPADAGRVDLLTGRAADEATFKREAPGHRVIHLATHGVMVSDTCVSPANVGLRGVGGVAPMTPGRPARTAAKHALTVDSSARRTSPWLGRQVWLALAGANRPPSDAGDENEGLLTAEEIATLDLRGTDWVVLSACRSGVADAWAREGAQGMRRAFQLAGARAVIASQWPVADRATREWMDALYRARARGMPAGAAVREACRSVLAARRRDGRPTAPFFWAAFTATGE